MKLRGGIRQINANDDAALRFRSLANKRRSRLMFAATKNPQSIAGKKFDCPLSAKKRTLAATIVVAARIVDLQ
ncbi:hypothetical protein BN77_3464 [Rhizobium mesoamericanum STM3625]|uniref:Uncharacterized protein n=1 Tax=Rhizobium mesoamericanum STM3625 TaxID=1211777 RepID=K0PIU8_9HYPH|nr:hypothetical protein BN77_3464 [Rhizobium mesoamericanum STM3625]